jgi:tetratricopeptide (TPR) repeat protein
VNADRLARFWQLMQEGYALVQKSDLPEALKNFQKAFTLASSSRDQGLADKAAANRSMVLLEQGRYKKAAKGLREIILRSLDDETACGAAYNLSISLRRQGHYQKAFFYAKLAIDKARSLKDKNWIARCHNLSGNLHLMQSRFKLALGQYRKSLAIRKKEKPFNKFSAGLLQDNIGYCQLLLGRYKEGVKEILAARELSIEVGNRRGVCECSHDLAFGYMQLRMLDEAEKFGESALATAEELDCKEIIKNCYYILGEIYHLKGDEERRDLYFYQLQRMHPHLPFLRDFLCTFDVSNIIALRFPQ